VNPKILIFNAVWDQYKQANESLMNLEVDLENCQRQMSEIEERIKIDKDDPSLPSEEALNFRKEAIERYKKDCREAREVVKECENAIFTVIHDVFKVN
jgi:chromosome segregation ATPase